MGTQALGITKTVHYKGQYLAKGDSRAQELSLEALCLWIMQCQIMNGGIFCYLEEKTHKFLYCNPFSLPASFCFQGSSLVMLNHDLGREVAIIGNQVLQARVDPCSFDLEPILRRWTAHKEHKSATISRKGQSSQLQSHRYSQGATEKAERHFRDPKVLGENTEQLQAEMVA